MQTRAYSICRKCCAVYPEGRRCPNCDNDAEARRVIAEATTCAVEATRMVRTRSLRGGALVVTGVVAVSLLTGLGMLALAFV